MNKEDKIKIELIKQKIETEKTALDRYVKTIVKYSFIENCTGGAYFSELKNNLLRNGFNMLEESNKSKEEKRKLQGKWFPLFYGEKTEVERWESNLKYQKSLTNWAKNFLEGLDDKKKEKIIIDCITQSAMWSEQFNRNSILYDELEEKKKKVKKIKRRKTTSKKIRRKK